MLLMLHIVAARAWQGLVEREAVMEMVARDRASMTSIAKYTVPFGVLAFLIGIYGV